MSYLFVNSSYRDRILYPYQSDYIIPFQTIHSLTQNLNVLNTLNPLSVYPAYTFCWTNYLSTNSFYYKTHIRGGSGTSIQLDNEIYTQLLGLNNSIPTFYVRQSVDNTIDILTNYIVLLNQQQSIILSYSPTYNTITITDTIPFQIGDEIVITNDILLIDSSLDPQSTIIVNGNLRQVLFANQIYIYNIDINEKRLGKYNTTLQVLQTESPFSQPIQATNKYLIFNQLNLFITGTLEIFDNNKYYIENCVGDYKWIDQGQHYSIYQQVYLVESESEQYLPQHTLFKIKNINSFGGITELEMTEIGWQTFYNNKTYIVKILNGSFINYKFAKILVQSIQTIFKYTIPNHPFQFQTRDFIGNYFQCILLSPLYHIYEKQLYLSPNFTIPIEVNPQYNNLYEYQNNNGIFGITKVLFLNDTQVLLFVEKVPPYLLKRFDLYQQILLNSQSSIPKEFQGCLNGLIYHFTKEGIVPLNFSGTYLTQSTMTCYEMNVISLILPNTPIDNLNSYLTSAFPYVLLEISNVTMPMSHNINTIYSNNPYTNHITFVVPISDVSDPIFSKFIKLNSGGMSQIIKFTPADNLRFRLLLPNGELFKTSIMDYAPPSEPNPLIQISLVIQLKKL